MKAPISAGWLAMLGTNSPSTTCWIRRLSWPRRPACSGTRGHHRICSKSYSKDSGMIPRLDVAVERRASGARFGGPPWWATCPLNK